jgi:hypothetical protein
MAQGTWNSVTLDENAVFVRKLDQEIFIEQGGLQVRGQIGDWLLTTRDNGVFIVMTEAQLDELTTLPAP